MIRAQREFHARVWPAIGLVLLIALVVSVLVRTRGPYNAGPLPGAAPAQSDRFLPAGNAPATNARGGSKGGAP